MKPLALVIEDVSDQANLFSTALRLAGYKVELIRDGLIAQKRLNETVPDLVLLDLHIPRVTGDVLLQQIKNDPRLAETKVIIATGDAFLAETLEKDADLVLLKPIEVNQLRDLAMRLVTQSG
jgi:CheY-like chemotaxis protein